MDSRLPTYLHPVAGRPLVWHTLSLLASLLPHPKRLLLLAASEIHADLFRDVDADVSVLYPRDRGWTGIPTGGTGDSAPILMVDAAAPTAGAEIAALLGGPMGRVIREGGGRLVAACLEAGEAERIIQGEMNDPRAPLHPSGEAGPLLVRDRATLARATGRIRDRLVGRLMEQGVTFLLPETVLLDVDVRIGRDCVVYPGVVLEGQTEVGEETVIGPGCRIIDSRIGSGVELKGWNYLSHTSIRNRAILEPGVRRGFD